MAGIYCEDRWHSLHMALRLRTDRPVTGSRLFSSSAPSQSSATYWLLGAQVFQPAARRRRPYSSSSSAGITSTVVVPPWATPPPADVKRRTPPTTLAV